MTTSKSFAYRLILAILGPLRGPRHHASSRSRSSSARESGDDVFEMHGARRPGRRSSGFYREPRQDRRYDQGARGEKRLSRPPSSRSSTAGELFAQIKPRIAPDLKPIARPADPRGGQERSTSRSRRRPTARGRSWPARSTVDVPVKAADRHPRPARGDHDLLHGLHDHRPGDHQPLGLLPDLGVRRGGPLSPRASLCAQKFLPFSLGLFLARASSSASTASCR